MDKFVLDREKAIRLAKELGLDVTFDAVQPGVLIREPGKETIIDFVQFFPEMSLLDSDFSEKDKYVTKEEGQIDIHVEFDKIPVKQRKQAQVVVVSTFTKQGNLILAS